MPDIVLSATTDLTHDQRMQRTARALQDAGYQVLLVGRCLPGSLPLNKEPYSQYRLQPPLQKGKGFYLFFNIQLFFLLLRKPAKALVAVDFDTLLGTFMASSLKRIPCVLDAHEFFTEVPELKGRRMSRLAWHCLGRIIIPRLSAAYTVNQSLARLLSTCYKKPFHVVRNLPESHLTPKPSSRGEPFLLYQGALNEGRGLETLINIAHRLPVPVYLAGDGDLKATLKQQVSDQGLTKQVIFLGKLSPDELQDLTPQAFLGYNLLSDSSRNYYYSLANKFFDYIQAGVPSLSNPFPEYTRITAQYPVARLIPLDEETIVQTVWNLWHHTADYENMRKACMEAGAVFTWEDEIPALLNIYKGLLAPKQITVNQG